MRMIKYKNLKRVIQKVPCIMNHSMSIYDLMAWRLLEEKNLKGSMQLPIISKDPAWWERECSQPIIFTFISQPPVGDSILLLIQSNRQA